MIYNNFLCFFVVILMVTTAGPAAEPLLPGVAALALFLLKAGLYQRWLSHAFSPARTAAERHYFQAEQRGFILAVASLALDVYLLDGGFYLHRLPGAGRFPALAEAAGLLLYFLYLAMLWSAARSSYEVLFRHYRSRLSFVLVNAGRNLPIVLPWLVLSLLLDLVHRLPVPRLRQLLDSPWGDFGLLLLFILILAMIFPVLVKRLWGCVSLEPGRLRRHLEEFCRGQQLKFADIMIWPLYEGRILTAAVMGMVGRFRYLLITPALLRALSLDELEAVVAHEIGHVKRYHLQLYIVLLLGFGVLMGLLGNPLFYLVLDSELFYRLVSFTNRNPATALTFWSTVPLLVMMILYFRYIFGFFMRNFERQADLHVFQVLGDCAPLIASFEKIAWLSGNIRDQPSWHHFSIGQRVDFLEKCRSRPGCIKGHHRKVHAFLLLYLAVLAAGAALVWAKPVDLSEARLNNRFLTAVLEHKINREPDKAEWYRMLGDVRQAGGAYQEAADAYERGVSLAPADADLLNNYAWLLLTAEAAGMPDPARALELARTAAALKPTGYILDTLAVAHWAAGELEPALAAERRAMRIDPENRPYYRDQMAKMKSTTWEESYPGRVEGEGRP